MSAPRRLPILLPGINLEEVARERKARVLSLMRSGRTLENARTVAREGFALAARLTVEVKRVEPPTKPFACKEGCDFCCFVLVHVTAPEVFNVIEHLRETLSADAFAALRDRVVASDARTRGMSADERAHEKLACPLLQDRRCIAYEARPLACRSWNSTDARPCERAKEHPEIEDDKIPNYVPQVEVGTAVTAITGSSLHQDCLDGLPLELNAALRIALERPNAFDRWARGMPVFLQARDPDFAAGVAALADEHR